MNLLRKILDEKIILENEEKQILQEIQTLRIRENIASQRLNSIKKNLYSKKIYQTHLEEIIRLAQTHFPRLRKSETNQLNSEDYRELNKWTSRVKSEEGLKDIISALEELEKYTPSQVANIYALTQKIIIGGAYKKTRR